MKHEQLANPQKPMEIANVAPGKEALGSLCKTNQHNKLTLEKFPANPSTRLKSNLHKSRS
jgi:hypothetical protein